MLDKCRLSIIVPIYNVEKYVAKTINSIVNQKGFDKFEIIVVNDGSKDSSRDIVSEIAYNYNNIIIIDQENMGLGGARNTGIGVASGKYILFIDSDDYIENDCLSRYLDIADQNNLDMLQLAHVNVDDVGCILGRPNNPQSEGVVSGRLWISNGDADPASCFHLYNRQFLLSTGVTFMERVYHEDMDFTYHVMYYAKRMMSLDEVYYYYVDRKGSITGEKSLRKCQDYYEVACHVSEWVQDEVDEDVYEAFFREYLAFLFLHPINQCISFGIQIRGFIHEGKRRDRILENIKRSESLGYKLAFLLLKTKCYFLYSKMYRFFFGKSQH